MAAQAKVPKDIDWDHPPAGYKVEHAPLTKDQAEAFFEGTTAVTYASIRDDGAMDEAAVKMRATVQAYTVLAVALGGVENTPLRIRYNDLEMDYLVPAPEEEGEKTDEQETR